MKYLDERTSFRDKLEADLEKKHGVQAKGDLSATSKKEKEEMQTNIEDSVEA